MISDNYTVSGSSVALAGSQDATAGLNANLRLGDNLAVLPLPRRASFFATLLAAAASVCCTTDAYAQAGNNKNTTAGAASSNPSAGMSPKAALLSAESKNLDKPTTTNLGSSGSTIVVTAPESQLKTDLVKAINDTYCLVDSQANKMNLSIPTMTVKVMPGAEYDVEANNRRIDGKQGVFSGFFYNEGKYSILVCVRCEMPEALALGADSDRVAYKVHLAATGSLLLSHFADIAARSANDANFHRFPSYAVRMALAGQVQWFCQAQENGLFAKKASTANPLALKTGASFFNLSEVRALFSEVTTIESLELSELFRAVRQDQLPPSGADGRAHHALAKLLIPLLLGNAEPAVVRNFMAGIMEQMGQNGKYSSDAGQRMEEASASVIAASFLKGLGINNKDKFHALLVEYYSAFPGKVESLGLKNAPKADAKDFQSKLPVVLRPLAEQYWAEHSRMTRPGAQSGYNGVAIEMLSRRLELAIHKVNKDLAATSSSTAIAASSMTKANK